MSKGIVFSPCPFCGAKIEPVICNRGEGYWANGLWFIDNTHDKDCPLYLNNLFGYVHFGKAEDGKPTKELAEFAKKWNRRENE